MKEVDEFLDFTNKVRLYQEGIQAACCQSYVYIEFGSHHWTWGTVTYRLEMSGKGYEVPFSNRLDLLNILSRVEAAAMQECYSLF